MNTTAKGRLFTVSKGIVLSLYDFTGEALRPWAEAGYTCFAYDIQHERDSNDRIKCDSFEGGGSISYVHMDLHNLDNIEFIRQWFGLTERTLYSAWHFQYAQT